LYFVCGVRLRKVIDKHIGSAGLLGSRHKQIVDLRVYFDSLGLFGKAWRHIRPAIFLADNDQSDGSQYGHLSPASTPESIPDSQEKATLAAATVFP
jgi:hypothetical protein